jgi:hypothetical protein
LGRSRHVLLRLEFLHGEGGLSVPVRIGSFDGTTLIECHDPAAFLRLVLSDRQAGLGGAFTP